MKTLLFLIFLPILARAQSYIYMGVKTNGISPVVTDARYGYQLNNNVLAEAGMRVPISNNANAAVYFLALTGYRIRIGEETIVAPVAGFGYKLVTTDFDKTHQNRMAWAAGGRFTHRWFMGEVAVLDKQLFVSVGLIGWFDKSNK